MVGVAAALAVMLHRAGHHQGDDFALYLRQARSLFDGDVAQVVADNRFTVINSPGPFSPIAYPWGWPLILSPFVHVWGLDFDKLKLLEVACFCIWLVLVHGIVRRRAGRILAFAITAVVGTAPMLLAHTDFLLSEYPHAVAIGVFVWWLDRISADSTLLQANTRRLVVLGVLAAVAYNVRRESIVLVVVLAITQLVQWLGARRGCGRTDRLAPGADAVRRVRRLRRRLPAAAAVDADPGQRRHRHVRPRAHRRLPRVAHPLARVGHAREPRRGDPAARAGRHGGRLLATTTAERALGCADRAQRPRREHPPAPRRALLLPGPAVGPVLRRHRRRRRRGRTDAAADPPVRPRRRRSLPLLYVVGVHAAVLPNALDRVATQESNGRQQFGPADPLVIPVFEAVLELTPPDAVITYYRARTMTLMTDRRAIQTRSTDEMMLRSDYFAQLRNATYAQPDVSPFEARRLGLEEVWADAKWVLWKVPAPGSVPEEAAADGG